MIHDGSEATQIAIATAVVDALVHHARSTHPRECCGLLIGTRDRIVRSWPATNLADRATRFLIDPRDHFAAIRSARAAGLDVMGAYHSHPTPPAEPSPTDLAESIDSSLLTVIVAPGERQDMQIRAFYLENGNFREVTLVSVP